MIDFLTHFTSKYDRLLNVILRAVTLASRFVFVFLLAKFVDPETVGYYGLFAATVGYAIIMVGMNYYNYTSRQILKLDPGQRGRLLKGQVALAAMVYVVALPVLFTLLTYAGWPGLLIWWFLPILVLEHLNQEIYRLLIAVSEQLTAGFVLFLRQGSWAIGVILLMSVQEDTRDIATVLAGWALAAVCALMIGLWQLRTKELGGWKDPINWQWVRTGIAVSLGLFIAALAQRGILTMDRYWLESLGGLEVLAAYVLFTGFANTLIAFLDAGVFAYTYPKLIVHFQKQELDESHELIKKALAQTVIVCLGFTIIAWLVAPIVIGWVGNPLYLAYMHIFPWVLFAMVANAISMVPHYGLYARNCDKYIIGSQVIAFAVFVASAHFMSMAFAEMAVPYALLLSFMSLLALKAFFYLYVSTMKAHDS